jgi:hypothetical protein
MVGIERRPSVGQAVRMARSGHSRGSPEGATVVAVHRSTEGVIVQVRWSDGRETFVPSGALEGPAEPTAGAAAASV